MRMIAAALALVAFAGSPAVQAADQHPFAALKARLIGPASSSGRISDFAFHPSQRQIFYAATASAGIWKTMNNGITWAPVFEGQGSYSVGVIEMDPNDPLTLWAGTGENNSQRSVAYGDGIYRTTDGGKSWTHMGLKSSEHISQIWINPANSDHLRVAVQGALWNDSEDRGLYETTDGGKSWAKLLYADAATGVNEFVVHPDNPDMIVASTYQRRRHVWTLINGGPGSGIHVSQDGGKSWKRITAALPKDHMGRIGLAMAPSSPNTVYAIIEGQKSERGVYRSQDFGQSWTKRSGYAATSPQYYNELIVDPHNPDRVYSMDTYSAVSNDGGKSFTRLSAAARHVDDHALWIDPDNTDHLYIGGDGGIYESWDQGQTWRHFENLPIVQFYRATPDNAEPFYNICGGTQDNNSQCGPSRTTFKHGIANSDWRNILGGDGYEPVSDPTDPNIVYTQYQYGGLARYDWRTQERLYIAPEAPEGQPSYKFNWNTPLIISPHSSTRLYFGGEKLLRSDDRGNSWREVSPDLTAQIDRDSLEVMGRVWSVDTIAKNVSTSIYGALIGISESPLIEGLIVTGSDDGVIAVTDNGGEDWRKLTAFKGVPDQTYVSDVLASSHDSDVIYATFDNHKNGDFKPYVIRSTDRGKSWKLITDGLPDRGSAHSIVEDHVDPNLLFLGTEFGLFFSQNAGQDWTQIKNGLPVIAVRDLEIQRRENDLVIATFGRGIYVIDDYTPMRTQAAAITGADATLFPVKDALQYIVGDKYSVRNAVGHKGDQFWQVDNPDFGAVFTYYLKDSVESRAKRRRTAELKRAGDGEDNPYPSFDTLRTEAREPKPQVMLHIRDAAGNVVARIAAKSGKGMHRTAWDLRYQSVDAISLTPQSPGWYSLPEGPLAPTGTYSTTLVKRVDGADTVLAGPQTFLVKELRQSPEITQDRAALFAFQKRTADLKRELDVATTFVGEVTSRLDHLDVAVNAVTGDASGLLARLRTLRTRLADISLMLSGDRVVASRQYPTEASIRSLVGGVIFSSWLSQSDPAQQHVDAIDRAAKAFTVVSRDLQGLAVDLDALEADMAAQGAPGTPGRIPTWPR